MTLIKLEFSGKIFENYTHMKFNLNLSRGGRVFPSETADMTKPRVDGRNLANAPKNETRRKINVGICDNNSNTYYMQLGCYPVAVVILHVNKI